MHQSIKPLGGKLTEVRRLRKERGLTQKELAIAADLSQATICRIEKNPRERKGGISLESAVSVARALDIDVTDLFRGFVINPTQGRPPHSGTKLNYTKPIRISIVCPKCNTLVSLKDAADGLSECCSAALAA
jgi:DNA-binding XRE family transcriptional regulator